MSAHSLPRDDAQRCAEHVLLREAEHLDAEAYVDWLDMLDEAMVYWVPLDPHARDETEAPSIFLEDKLLLEMRIARFRHARAYGREATRRTLHQVTGVKVDPQPGVLDVRSQIVVHEFDRGRLTLFPGRQRHRLVQRQDRWLIQRKEVHLINSVGVFDPIEIIL